MVSRESGDSFAAGKPRPPVPAELARSISDWVRGPTGHAAEQAILDLLEKANAVPNGLASTFYELSRIDGRLPEKMIRDVADRSISDRLHGREQSPEALKLWSMLMDGAPVPRSRDAMLFGLLARAMEIGSISEPAVATYARERLRDTDGQLSVFGATLDRLDRRKASQKGTFGNRALNFAYHFYDKTRLTHVLNTLMGTHDTESPAEVQRALTSPKVRGADGVEKSLGDVTVLVNGMLNLEPTAPMMFRLARHTAGPVILASSNPDGADGYRLRELTEIWGVPVPPELKGKLWAIGDVSATMITWPQGSDLLIEHLGIIDAQFAALKAANPKLAGVDSFRAAKTTVVGYSQGALSATAARKRLEDAGLPDVIDNLIAVAGDFAGTPFADGVDSAEDLQAGQGHSGPNARVAQTLEKILAQVDGEEGARTFESNDPDFVRRMSQSLGLSSDLVDVSYYAKASSPTDKVEPIFGSAARLLEWALGNRGHGSDGVILTGESQLGRKVVMDESPKSHLMIWKDQDTVDRILEAL